MLVYHGSDCLFDAIDLSRSKDKRDFGTGFYTTTIAAQAESWARNMKLRHRAPCAYVYVYEWQIKDELSIKQFEGLSVEWLNMIRENRSLGGLRHGYDVVQGPVADDNTLLTVNRYMNGTYTAEEAIGRLQYARANDQVSFHTQRAIGCLRLVRRYEVGE